MSDLGFPGKTRVLVVGFFSSLGVDRRWFWSDFSQAKENNYTQHRRRHCYGKGGGGTAQARKIKRNEIRPVRSDYKEPAQSISLVV